MNKMMLAALLSGVSMASVNAQSTSETASPVSTITAEELTKAPASSWTDALEFKGDIRFRLEQIDKDGSDTRNRGRVRARLQADAKISDELSATVALASGGEDPVSSNQSFDEGFSSKGINLDQAVLKITPSALDGFKVQLGKMKTPFIQVNNLVWDGDLRPEGASVHYAIDANENLSLVFNGGGFVVEERSSESETMLYGAQAAVDMKSDDVKLQTGVSLYYYDNIDGFAPVFDEEDSFGNSTTEIIDPVSGDVTGIVYANGYEIIELFAKVGFEAGLPISINGSYVMNEDADDNETGYQAGIKFGKRKDPGSFDFGYAYRRLEADAVLGVFTDSDAFGGGTDGKTHIIKAGYQMTRHLSGSVTYFTGEAGLDDATDYDRIQIDIAGKF